MKALNKGVAAGLEIRGWLPRRGSHPLSAGSIVNSAKYR